MKITKIRTKAGEFQAPVSTELDAIVERMRSKDIKETANRITKIALQSRLMIQQGGPRILLEDTERLPYLIFSATFGRSNINKPLAFTGLMMLNIPCPQGIQQVSEMRRRVSQIPYTVLAFAGVSGVTLKVVVKVGKYKSPTTKAEQEKLDTEDHIAFLKDAHESAARL